MSLVAEIERWRARLASIDPEVLSAGDCTVLVAALAVLGKACDAARARVGARAESCGAHAKAGFVDGAEWLAVASGTTAVDARRAMDAASALPAGSETERAWRDGELSVAQAAQIAKAA